MAASGLSDVRAWVRPFHVLSTGQRARAELSRRITSGGRLFDNFTSTCNRDVGKSMAAAIGRYIRESSSGSSGGKIRGVVFASPHHDIVRFLQPDWALVCDLQGHSWTLHFNPTTTTSSSEASKPSLLSRSAMLWPAGPLGPSRPPPRRGPRRPARDTAIH